MTVTDYSRAWRPEASDSCPPAPQNIGISEDFDHDGHPDVAVANLRPHDLSVRLNDGQGGLLAEVTYPVNVEPAILAAGDLNGDTNLGDGFFQWTEAGTPAQRFYRVVEPQAPRSPQIGSAKFAARRPNDPDAQGQNISSPPKLPRIFRVEPLTGSCP